MVEITSWSPSKTCTAKLLEQQLRRAIVLCAQVLIVGPLSGEGKAEGEIAAAADRSSATTHA
jgi:hypothetical protein